MSQKREIPVTLEFGGPRVGTATMAAPDAKGVVRASIVLDGTWVRDDLVDRDPAANLWHVYVGGALRPVREEAIK